MENLNTDIEDEALLKQNTRLWKIVRVLTRFSIWSVLFLLFGGHETANPELGHTKIEFYSSSIRNALINAVNIEPNKQCSTNLEFSLVNEFYSERNYMPAWTINYGIGKQYKQLISLLNSARYYGLIPENYNIEELKFYEGILNNEIEESTKFRARVQLEVVASASAFKFMIHLASGIHHADTSNYLHNLTAGLPGYLNRQIGSTDIKKGFLLLQPQNKQYCRLQKALTRYLQTIEFDTSSYSVKKIAQDSVLLSRLLTKRGLLNKDSTANKPAIHNAIIKLQEVHNLKLTGNLDEKTLQILSLSTSETFYIIALNLDRMRKHSIKEARHILINIPEFTLHYTDQKGEDHRYNIIVGKEESPTPIITSSINKIITNPYWNVPRDIIVKEIIPSIKKDTLFLQKNGYYILDDSENPVNIDSVDWTSLNTRKFRYWIRQKNSENSALGTIKFLFPNKYSVFLHDTPSKSLFRNNVRAYSHGCVRVENPEKLALQIVEEQFNANQNTPDLKKILKKKKSQVIRLTDPVPIAIRYYTCIADSNNNLSFFTDIYSYDKNEIKDLFEINLQ